MAQQWEEFECMLSMFPDPAELHFDLQMKEQFEAHVCFGGPRPATRLQYTIRYKDLGFGKEIPALEITYPAEYPETATVEFTIRCPFLSRQQMETLQTQLTLLATGAHGEVVVLQLYQEMLEMLTEAHAEAPVEAATGNDNDDDDGDLTQALHNMQMSARSTAPVCAKASSIAAPVVLGRRAIYFHHIINPNKRRVVMEWAVELQLGGFSKIGWPGIVVVEGHEGNAQEYVRRLQHLRWKQMVVRGEQTEQSGKPDDTIDAMRRLPRGFQEFPESGMSALAAACRDAGVEELFLTTMKIYGRSEEEPSNKPTKHGNSASSKADEKQGKKK